MRGEVETQLSRTLYFLFYIRTSKRDQKEGGEIDLERGDLFSEGIQGY